MTKVDETNMRKRSILIVEDDPMNVQLIRVLLAEDGYQVRWELNDDQALAFLTSSPPSLILISVQVGNGGMELIRQLRAKPELTNTCIIALSGWDGKEDEQRCIEAGCDGYIVKPLHSARFLGTVRSFMERKSRAVQMGQLLSETLQSARCTFITDSLVELTEFLSSKCEIDRGHLLRTVQRWNAIAGAFGMHKVTAQASEVEGVIERTEKLDFRATKESLVELHQLIKAEIAWLVERFLPRAFLDGLSGKCVALGGFSEPEASRIAQTLARAESTTVVIPVPTADLSPKMLERFDLIVLNVVSVSFSGSENGLGLRLNKPVLLVGSPESRSNKALSQDFPDSDFLTIPYTCEELLVRCCTVVSSEAMQRDATDSPRQVIIADDDRMIGKLIDATLRDKRVECRLAYSGAEALALIREVMPDVLILDINMPRMDGFKVLNNLRAGSSTADLPVVLLTARAEELDVLKAFCYGADDYITKPCNPMEVEARVSWHLQRTGRTRPSALNGHS